MMIKISVLFVTLLLATTFFSKSLAKKKSQPYCGILEDVFYSYCRTKDTLLSVTSGKPIGSQLNNLTITDENIFDISNAAFDSELQLGNLTLNFGYELLHFSDGAFTGLDKLTILNINNGKVLLKTDAFKKLISLKSLKFEADENPVRLHEFLPNLGNLTELELLRVDEMHVCPSQDNLDKSIPQIKKLRYTTGRGLKKLKSNSFFCLKNLNFLSITDTFLDTIEEGAFNGLEKLEKLTLTMNKKLRDLPASTFDNFVNSIELDLHGNSIEVIEIEALNPQITNFISIDLSSNELSYIGSDVFHGVRCEILNLSSNDITTIDKYSFSDAKILKILLFNNPLLHLDGLNLDISIYTMIYDSPTHYFMKSKYLDNCELLENGIFKICIFYGRLSLVREIKLNVIEHKETYIPSLEISQIITSIDDYAFYNLSIKELVIKSIPNNQIDINPLAFDLPKLEILEFQESSILLKKNMFKKLTSLKYLSSKFVETNYSLCKSLQELTNIKYLTIVDHDKINICDEKCANNKLKLISLEYSGGDITHIQANAFTCLELDHFTIADTNLKTIDRSAFNGLKNLTTLSITSNKYLTNIPALIFDNLIQLYVLHINDFYIKRLDIEIVDILRSLKSDENMILINLNENRLIYSVDGSIRQLSWQEIIVSSNNINLTSTDDFTKQKNHIFLYNTTGSKVNDAFEILKSHRREENSCLYKSSVCINTETSPVFEVCINSDDVLTSVTNTDPSVPVEKFNLDIDCIKTIGQYAFDHSTIQNELTITSYVEKLNIENNPFFYLPNLTYLRFLDSVVQLGPSSFDDLLSLETLILSIDETNERLCKVLPDLPSLLYLEITNYDKINICNNRLCGRNNAFRIKELFYTGGAISKIQNNSFKCVPYLNYLSITNTNLTTIESNAFNGLKKLQTLSLSHNKINFIRKDNFKNLKNLQTLLLQYNNIQEIEATTFALMNANLLELSLRVNKLNVLKKNTFYGLKCNALHLSSNDIGIIEDGAFTNSQIEDLYYFDNPDISIILDKINLSNLTKIHQYLGKSSIRNQQPKSNCKLLCPTCDFICETTASKIATNIQNQEMMNINSNDNNNNNNQKSGIDKHANEDGLMGNCKKYCAKCPLICN